MEKVVSEEQLEKLRNKAKRRLYFVYVVSALSLLFYMWLFYLSMREKEPMSWLFIAELVVVSTAVAIGTMALLAYLFVNRSYNKFNHIFKSKYVLQTISEISGFGELQYMPNGGFQWDEIRNAAVVDCGEKKYFESEDLLLGIYENTHFKVSDVTTQKLVYRNEKQQLDEIFSGQVICLLQFDDTKTSNGYVQIFQKKYFSDISGWKAEHKIHTENENFHQYFDVYANDAHNAFYILTPQRIEKIIKLKDAIGKQISLTFYQNKLFVAVRRSSMFDAVVDKPVAEQTKKIIEDVEIIQKAKEILVTS